METGLTGAERRKKILSLMKESEMPLSGGALGKLVGVSRQVIVQDIAFLRLDGHEIVATARGYVLDEPKVVVRTFKTYHTDEQTEEELLTIVDLGGCILDVTVNHKVYGKVTAPLNIKNRRDVQWFLEQLRSGKSTHLKNVTSGYHFHKVSAENEMILNEIEKALLEKQILAEIFSYEIEAEG